MQCKKQASFTAQSEVQFTQYVSHSPCQDTQGARQKEGRVQPSLDPGAAVFHLQSSPQCCLEMRGCTEAVFAGFVGEGNEDPNLPRCCDRLHCHPSLIQAREEPAAEHTNVKKMLSSDDSRKCRGHAETNDQTQIDAVYVTRPTEIGSSVHSWLCKQGLQDQPPSMVQGVSHILDPCNKCCLNMHELSIHIRIALIGGWMQVVAYISPSMRQIQRQPWAVFSERTQ